MHLFRVRKPPAAVQDERPRGFTLLEVLVGMGIFSLLVAVMMQMLSQSSQLWVSSKRQVEHAVNSRAVADFLGKDLRSALPPLDRTAKNSLQLVVNPAGLGAAYLNRDSIFWQAPVSNDLAAGDIAIVGYYVKWVTGNSGEPKSVLVRFFAQSSDNAGKPNTHFLIYSKPTAWVTSALLEEVAPADQANSHAGVFAENVLGLWVNPQDSRGNSVMVKGAFDSRENAYDDDHDNDSQTPPINRIFPRWIDVSILTVDSAAASRIDDAMKAAIQGVVTKSESAVECRDSALATDELRPIHSGLRFYTTRIFLENS